MKHCCCCRATANTAATNATAALTHKHTAKGCHQTNCWLLARPGARYFLQFAKAHKNTNKLLTQPHNCEARRYLQTVRALLHKHKLVNAQMYKMLQTYASKTPRSNSVLRFLAASVSLVRSVQFVRLIHSLVHSLAS